MAHPKNQSCLKSHLTRKERLPKMHVKRGDIYYCDLPQTKGKSSIQSGKRPVIIIQNDIGNKYSPTTIVAPLTTVSKRSHLPTHVTINPCDVRGIETHFEQSTILCEQIITIDKRSLIQKVCWTDLRKNCKVNKALATSIMVCGHCQECRHS